MNKIVFFLSLIIIINTKRVSENKTSKNNTNLFTHAFCENSQNNFFCQHPLISYLGLLLILIGVIIGSYIYMKYFFNENTSFMRGWENYINRRLALKRAKKLKEKELLMKKKKFYLLNNIIKEINFSKDFANNEEECPICLGNYEKDKKVCFTPCKHLFHHLCLKEYIYGSKEMKCPICKFDLYEFLQNKKINYNKIKIVDNYFNNYLNDVNQENNEIFSTSNSNNNINLSSNDVNERENLNNRN